jgi:Tol biopolymer transport system component
VSADGRYVTFGWFGFDLSTGQSLADGHVFLRDRQAQTTTLIDRSGGGARGNDNSWQPMISADGRSVVFTSWATNLVAEDSGANANIYIRDIPTGMITRASLFLPSTAINGEALEPSISADGRFIAFTSAATNLVPNDTNQSTDIFLYDRDLGLTERVSLNSDGAQGLSDSIDPVISADGRFIVFSSTAPNLVNGDTNGRADVFLRDRQEGTTVRVSANITGAETASDADDVGMSADGRFIAFSTATQSFWGGCLRI